MCLDSCFIMAYKYHQLNSWGQTEGKKKQARSVMKNEEYVKIFGWKHQLWSSFSPVTEPFLAGRRSLFHSKLGFPTPKMITIKTRRKTRMRNTKYATGKITRLAPHWAWIQTVFVKTTVLYIRYWFPQLLFMPDRWPQIAKALSS